MAGQKPTTFTPESAERIARVVRAIENRPPKNPLNPDFDLPAMGGNWQFIKITGGITGGDTGCDPPDDVDAMTVVQYYPGIIRQYNSETELWEDTTLTVWCEPAPGVTLIGGDQVLGRQVRTNACILGNSRPLFAVFKGGGCTGTINEFLGACLTVTNNTNGAVSAPATVSVQYQNLDVDASGSSVALTMDDPTTFASEEITLRKIDSSTNAVTVNPFASETFTGWVNGSYLNAVSSITLTDQGQAVTLYRNGSNWGIKSSDGSLAQSPNTILAGPVSGSNAPPTYRAVDPADIEAITNVIVSANDVTAQTAAVTLCSYTIPAADGTYRAGGYVVINSVATDVIKFRVGWRDENNNIQQIDMTPNGGANNNLGVVAAFCFPDIQIRVKASTVITIAVVITTGGGSVNYDAGGTVEKLR